MSLVWGWAAQERLAKTIAEALGRSKVHTWLTRSAIFAGMVIYSVDGQSPKRSEHVESLLLLAGELGNSKASSKAVLDGLWPRLVELHLDTVLVPIYWELLEPAEGQFDFTLVEHLLKLASQHDQRLVLLWFGSWKNSMSCYAPAWVKTQPLRFIRARCKDGTPQEILSPFSEENLAADRRAFVQLMTYLKQRDQAGRVIMVQVENEVAMLPEARDACDAANQAYGQPVPKELFDYLAVHQTDTDSPLMSRYREQGCPSSGSWDAVFGPGPNTEELFMAYYFARYLDRIAEAGKAVHPLPLFVNAALNRPNLLPGEYPSAGPLPHLFEIWQLAAPHIDLLSPDIYFPEFELWCQRYLPQGSLFIPEATNGPECAAHALYAIGACSAIGFSPFTVEAIDPNEVMLGQAYAILASLKEKIVASRHTDSMSAVLLTRDAPRQELRFGGYRLRFAHDYTWECSGPLRHTDSWPKGAALVLMTGPDEFIVVGTAVIVKFEPWDQQAGQIPERAGILFIDECNVENGHFAVGQRLNGDESHQGRHLRIPAQCFGAQRVRLYRYR